jgi:hypothetical protein
MMSSMFLCCELYWRHSALSIGGFLMHVEGRAGRELDKPTQQRLPGSRGSSKKKREGGGPRKNGGGSLLNQTYQVQRSDPITIKSAMLISTVSSP